MKRVLRERVDDLLAQRGIKTLGELHLRIQEYQPGFAWQTLSLVVNGKRYPRLDTLDAIARGLDTTIAYLIGEIADPAPPGVARISDQGVVYQIDTGGQEQRLLAVWRTLNPEDRERIYDMADRISQLTPRIVGEQPQE
ncbi:MAG: helix-turn-helix transcriptional regulator [Candidatus Kaiserbacteria bacterium]|nr:helix-turn-helix transcriptional regulator [Candidatus Kaiserbacteria bacterium]